MISPTPSESRPPRQPDDDAPPREVAGRWIVFAIFVFAIVMTGALWGYWRLHLGPFVPLQRAIVAEWKGSAPRVEGGRRKMHQSTPSILRVTLKVPFDPEKNSAEEELRRRTERIRELAAGVLDLSAYEKLEIHFFHPVPERKIRQRTIEIDL